MKAEEIRAALGLRVQDVGRLARATVRAVLAYEAGVDVPGRTGRRLHRWYERANLSLRGSTRRPKRSDAEQREISQLIADQCLDRQHDSQVHITAGMHVILESRPHEERYRATPPEWALEEARRVCGKSVFSNR